MALAACALAGCPSSATTTAYTPITGITVLASDLTAGFGCGTDPGQVYAYATLLSYQDDAGPAPAPVFSIVTRCYSNGQFSNLPPSVTGSLSFDVKILAWDEASFPTALQCFPPTPANPTAASICPGDDVATVLANQGTPNWSTTCTATQEPGVSVLAVCAPLAPSGSALVDDGGDDGGVGDGAIGDGGDAGIGDGGDASDAAEAGE
jgi:hypothetical protein